VLSKSRPRTLAESLRTWDEEALTQLLRARPDLGRPPPRDLAALAARSTSGASVGWALDQLDAWRRLVAEGLAALPDPSSTADLAQLLGQPQSSVDRAVRDLRARALVWGDDDRLHLVRPVREVFEPYPGGLAPPSARPLSPDQIDQAVVECSAEARAVLERLLWSPTGAVRKADRVVSAAAARSPVEELLARELLRPLDSDTVLLPREVSWQLRDRRFTPEPVSSEPPQVTGRRRGAILIDRAAAGAAFGLLHDLELVVQRMEEEPHRLLRTGGLGTRELALVARGLGADLAHTTFLVECASAAGLLAPGPGLALLPTSEYDRWVTLDAPTRWKLATRAWLRADRLFSRAAERGAHALGPEAEMAGIADLRATVLDLAAQAGAGTVVDLDQLAAAVAWHRPRLLDGSLDAVALINATWREGAWLGLVALDAVSSFAQLPARPDQAVPAELASLFPAPVEQIIIQNDLTAVAAGPLAYAVAQNLRRLADQESRGAAGVFRFSPTSLRRAYDHGWSAGDVHEWLARHSVTPVPQPLHYLVDDVARRHGGVRIGPALSYVRLEDETQAAALLARPDAADAGLRAIAPTVLVAAVEEEELLALLREAGHAPVVEDAYGQVRTQPAGPRMARPPVGRATEPATAAELAATLLATERAHPVRQRPEPSPSTDAAVHALRSATQEARPVRVQYVTADGQPAERELAPLDLGAGTVRAVDRDTAQVVTIPLARISSVFPVTLRD
jgi:hypothetical protein